MVSKKFPEITILYPAPSSPTPIHREFSVNSAILTFCLGGGGGGGVLWGGGSALNQSSKFAGLRVIQKIVIKKEKTNMKLKCSQ